MRFFGASCRFSVTLMALALAAPAALADGTCDVLDTLDDSGVVVVDVSASAGECSVELDDTTTLFSVVNPTADHCTESRIGNNPIVIWPANGSHGACKVGGNIVVVWPS